MHCARAHGLKWPCVAALEFKRALLLACLPANSTHCLGGVVLVGTDDKDYFRFKQQSLLLWAFHGLTRVLSTTSMFLVVPSWDTFVPIHSKPLSL